MEIKETEDGYKAETTIDGERYEYKYGSGSEAKAQKLAKHFGPDKNPENWVSADTGEKSGSAKGHLDSRVHKSATDASPQGSCPECGGPTSIEGKKCETCQ